MTSPPATPRKSRASLRHLPLPTRSSAPHLKRRNFTVFRLVVVWPPRPSRRRVSVRRPTRHSVAKSTRAFPPPRGHRDFQKHFLRVPATFFCDGQRCICCFSFGNRFLRGKGLSGFESLLLGGSLSSISIKGLFGIDIWGHYCSI